MTVFDDCKCYKCSNSSEVRVERSGQRCGDGVVSSVTETRPRGHVQG